ncbi:MAG: general secretion pathway protein GspB [Gammaproteobacteria bacterium]|nr:general secretion pathway protein GspB [Gammaproteobacteria bacterium]
MSYILDALKKSERERAVGADQRLPEKPAVTAGVALPGRLWPLALASGLVAGALVAVIMIWRGAAHESPGEPARRPPLAADSATLPLASVAELPPVREAQTPAATTQRAVSPPPIAAPTQAGSPAVAAAEAPFLRQLAPELQRQLPELAVTIHVYSPEESQRILFINNREYRRGDQVQEGLRVEEIVPDGAVLSFRGERFKLRRPF